MDEVTIKDPPENYALNMFLSKICPWITEGELARMKQLLRGRGGISPEVLQKLLTPLDFFNYLADEGFISLNDIVILQTLLIHLERDDLFNKVIQLRGSIKGVVHFTQSPSDPASGQEFARFHLNCSQLNRERVEKLRLQVSKWLNIPEWCVSIAGVVPTDSYIITLMIPEISIQELRLLTNEQKRWLSENRIDRLQLSGEDIDIKWKPTMDASQLLQEKREQTKDLSRLLKAADLEKINDTLLDRDIPGIKTA